MKIVINTCFGGYSISALATKKLAKRKGKKCYFFTFSLTGHDSHPISIEEAKNAFCWLAYSVDNPQDYKLNERDPDGSYKSANEREEKISLSNIADDRTDCDLIAVIEELGDKANGRFAKLKIVEIPDDVEWEIHEYDGLEHIAEVHRTWS